MENASDDHQDGPLLRAAMLDELEQLLGRDPLIELLRSHLQHGTALCRRLQALEPDRDAAFRLIHQIAGTSGSIGLERLGRYATGIERQLASIALQDLGAPIASIVKIWEATIDTLTERYPELTADVTPDA